MRHQHLALCALALCLSACLENEEEITIRPDGSSTFVVRAKGRADDLSDGHPLPLAGPWKPLDDATEEWARTHAAGARDSTPRDDANRAAAPGAVDAEQDLTLSVAADFESVADWPRWFAPDSEPYRTAFLERGVTLSIQPKGRRTVYTFERTFAPRTFQRVDAWSSIERELPQELRERLDHVDQDHLPTPEERAQVIEAAVSAYPRALLAFADDSLLADFTVGDASLATDAPERIHAEILRALETVVTRERIAGVLDRLLENDEERAGAELKALENDARTALRGALEQALRHEAIPAESRNAIRAELEWHLTAYDHTVDLGDEAFTIEVHMPGTVIGGNFDERDGSSVRWSFEGERLHDQAMVLRVVSVLE